MSWPGYRKPASDSGGLFVICRKDAGDAQYNKDEVRQQPQRQREQNAASIFLKQDQRFTHWNILEGV